MAPARPRPLGELALRRLGGDRACLDAGRAAEPPAARGCASRLRGATKPGRALPRRSSSSGSPTRSRASGGTSARIRVSARSRSACRTSRPGSRSRRRLPRSCRRWSREHRPGPAADRGFYAQNRWAALRFGATPARSIRTATGSATVEELFDELTARLAPTFDALGTAALLEPLAVSTRRGPARARTPRRPRSPCAQPRRRSRNLTLWPSRRRRCR